MLFSRSRKHWQKWLKDTSLLQNHRLPQVEWCEILLKWMAVDQPCIGSFYHHRLEAALPSMTSCAASPALPWQIGSQFAMWLPGWLKPDRIHHMIKNQKSKKYLGKVIQIQEKAERDRPTYIILMKILVRQFSKEVICLHQTPGANTSTSWAMRKLTCIARHWKCLHNVLAHAWFVLYRQIFQLIRNFYSRSSWWQIWRACFWWDVIRFMWSFHCLAQLGSYGGRACPTSTSTTTIVLWCLHFSVSLTLAQISCSRASRLPPLRHHHSTRL